ncbi:MAG TPA: phenylalanine--tRNA ligase subunit beta [Gaiellaceae bacterium]|jgi:phenylalanyl-tRNA synthetase beta chain|nr:phenylalanine--tRNA ligase subunit beta [Gaiellaceae bacterium]
MPMRIPLTWLHEYVPVEVPTAELAERLALSTLEVDRVLRLGVPDEDGNLGLYRVGLVVEAGKHPNADRLQLCRVDVGEGEPRQIVCGAWNFGGGATVAVALPGAILPGGRRLEAAKLRGQRSDGMILSERELELGTDHTGILVLDEPHEPGTPLADVLPLVEEVIEGDVTPNRVDLLSIYGIAREVAALYDLELAPPPGQPTALRITGNEPVEVRVEDEEGCPRYIGRLFRDVRIGPSPAWLRARLHLAGMRPISNVVDATNYAMLALGNPLHAFDRTKLAEARIVVRRARPGETIRTLDGADRRLDLRDLVIADAKRAVAIAGIMGSEASEVDESTTEVLLEAANFEPVGIMKSSERLALRTEGSNRWEKGVDPHLAAQAAALASELIAEHAGGRWVGQAEVSATLPEPPAVRLRPERTDELVGIPIDPPEQRDVLRRLGFGVDDWNVTVPTWRARDVTREVDLVEEVVRIHGLERVPPTMPLRRHMRGRLSRDQRLRRLVEDVLVGAGFSEAYTSSLVPPEADPDAIRLPEPPSVEQAALRTSLRVGLLDAARRNVALGNGDVSLFEIAHVYLPSGERLPHEPVHLVGITDLGFDRARGVVELVHAALHVQPSFTPAELPFLHPRKAAGFDGGWVGEVHPTVLEGGWGLFEIDVDTLFARAPDRVVYEPVVEFPAVRQDLAFIVGEDVPAGELVAAAREAVGPELREMRPFDVYRGEQIPPGHKSIAFAVVFQSSERTLSDEDAAGLRARLVEALRERFDAELRG